MMIFYLYVVINDDLTSQAGVRITANSPEIQDYSLGLRLSESNWIIPGTIDPSV